MISVLSSLQMLVVICLAASLVAVVQCWTQNEPPLFYIRKYETTSNYNHYQFIGNRSDYFKILGQDDGSILIGGRNALYNLSLLNLHEQKNTRIEWHSSVPHRELCLLKGKHDIDCQNYMRVFGRINDKQFMLCGTNSYKPLCRIYDANSGTTAESQSGGGLADNEPIGSGGEDADEGQTTDPVHVNEVEAQGRCPYNPRHSSSYVFSDGQLYSATVADFSGADPLIYREPQRTEQYDLKQLNQPDFISSVEFKEHIYFFFRETAMEYMNCGKTVYSRVARICKNDKGGPYPFNNRWTSFVKTRLNCSMPGEYPFYFNELKSTSQIVESVLPNGEKRAIIYGVFQTPENSIPGSAICAFDFEDISAAFEGRFKAQRDSTSNWLPVPLSMTPEPHPGKCVEDSRTMQSNSVNFIRKHPLMEASAPALYRRPLYTTVGLKERLSAITIDAQIKTVGQGGIYDVIYVGTEDGRVLKLFNYLDKNDTLKRVVISDVQVLPPGTPIKEITIAKASENLIVVSNGAVVTTPMHYCKNLTTCNDCVKDMHCTWHVQTHECISSPSLDDEDDKSTKNIKNYLQDVTGSFKDYCKMFGDSGNRIDDVPPSVVQPARGTLSAVGRVPHSRVFTHENEITVTSIDDDDIPDIIMTNNANIGSAWRGQIEPNPHNTYTGQTMGGYIGVTAFVSLLVGLVLGFCLSRKFHKNPLFGLDQRNHCWNSKSQRMIHPRTNGKDINLLMNSNHTYPQSPPTQLMNINNNAHHNNNHNNNNHMNNGSPKKDNLEFDGEKDRTQEYKNSTESLEKEMIHSKTGTLQKVKKTYI